MARVQFGVTNPRGTPLGIVDPAALAEKAEAWGYDSFWVPDLLTTSDLDPLVLLSGAATRYHPYTARDRGCDSSGQASGPIS